MQLSQWLNSHGDNVEKSPFSEISVDQDRKADILLRSYSLP